MSLNKTWAAILATFLTGIIAVADNGISGITEWSIVVATLLNIVNIYITPNLHGGLARWSKEITGVLLIIVGGLTPALLVGGVDLHEGIMLVLAALAPLVPNTPKTNGVPPA